MSPASGGPPLVKICGVTRPADAVRAVELGAAVVGLNFYPPSPRFLTVRRAAEIAEAVAGRALVAGVFVDPDPDRADDVARRAGLDLVQLHGDENPRTVARFGGRALRALRLDAAAGDGGPDPDLGPGPGILAPYPAAWGFLFDVRHPAYGGTGQSWSWPALAALTARAAAAGDRRPLLVAGGIRPENAPRALAESGAGGIDVCSGVESAPGVKDPVLLARLFDEVHHGKSPEDP
jgi:phosphoribosylanthranilate isomerase